MEQGSEAAVQPHHHQSPDITSGTTVANNNMEEPSTTTQQPSQQQTSLRFLRLQHDFQTMVKTGIGCVDEEVGCCSTLAKATA
jgi:hypothetical protein